MSKIREQWEKDRGYNVFKTKDPFSFKTEYVEELEQRLETRTHEKGIINIDTRKPPAD